MDCVIVTNLQKHPPQTRGWQTSRDHSLPGWAKPDRGFLLPMGRIELVDKSMLDDINNQP